MLDAMHILSTVKNFNFIAGAIENDVLILDIDPYSHFAWTGGTQIFLDKGRVSKYNKKFSNLRSKK